MSSLRPLRWKEGMFLRPHHMQQHDLFLESRDVAYLQGLEHYGWGLIGLEIQEDSLNNFVLAVKSLRAVFPDGTLVDVPGNARLPSRTLDKNAVEAGLPLNITVGVRRLEGRRPQAPEDGGAAGEARFAAVTEEVYDLDAGRDPTTLEQLEYDLRFFVGEEPTHGYETLPVARLAFTGNPGRPIQPSPGFAPPALVLSAAQALQQSTRAVVERLATVLRKKGEILGHERPSELVLFQALSGSLPVLRDMVQDGKVHPRRAYQEMARLVGTLYFRSRPDQSFEDIPAYDHRDPGPVFERLRALIEELSEIEIRRRYERVPMERIGDVFRAGLSAEGRKQGVRLVLEVSAAESSPRIRAILQTAKVSTPARIETLKQFALPGIATEPLAGAPPELPAGQTASFFRLKLEDGTEWSTYVVPGGALAALLMNAPQDLKLFLVVIFPGG